jgi:hypothetical protein
MDFKSQTAHLFDDVLLALTSGRASLRSRAGIDGIADPDERIFTYRTSPFHLLTELEIRACGAVERSLLATVWTVINEFETHTEWSGTAEMLVSTSNSSNCSR